MSGVTVHKTRLREIAERAEKASNGPWWFDGRDIFHKPLDNNLDQIVVPLPLTWHESQAVPRADAEFIAHAREDVPFLLDLLAVSRAETETLKDALREKDRVLEYYARAGSVRDPRFARKALAAGVSVAHDPPGRSHHAHGHDASCGICRPPVAHDPAEQTPHEGHGEDITEPEEPLLPETVEALRKRGIEFTDWTPTKPDPAEQRDA